jgi:hypothetical protein
VDAEVGKILLVSKRAAQKFNVEKFYLKIPDDVAGREEYRVKISNRFAALKNFSGSGNIVRFGKVLERKIP